VPNHARVPRWKNLNKLMLFSNSNREVLSGSRLRMRTAGRGQDVRPEKALYLNLEKRLIFLHSRVPRPSTSG